VQDRFQRRILDHLAHESYFPRRTPELADELGIPPAERAQFVAALHALEREGRIEVNDQGRISLPSLASRGGMVVGVFRKTRRGFGFVEPLEAARERKVFIPPEDVGEALTGDTVRIAIARDRRSPGGEGYVGRVLEIVERHRTAYTGTLEQRASQWVVLPDGRQITTPILVPDAPSTRARRGDKVVVELTLWPEGDMLAEGVITRVLGEAGQPDVETQAIIAAYDLPGEFPEECLTEARQAAAKYEKEIALFLSQGPASLADRLDLTDDFIITIDPPDAKDYDDAISIKRLDDGGWELGVHIADVAHFIPRNGPLDLEARRRGNSVYLPRHVIPMLPELLSNGICSLQEQAYRFCKSVFLRYDPRGEVRSESVAQTLIRSSKRLTYLEAQALIDGDEELARRHARTKPAYSERLIDTLREMNACAKAIQARRDRQGMIVLDLPEVVLIYDDDGRVIDAEREDDAFTHKLIEMFMVEANEVLARLFEGLNIPLLRRIHPDPVPGDVDTMRKVAMVAGFRIPRNPTREELQGLLKATAGTPAARAVHLAVLRTLSKAEYSPALIGHFALASDAYAHFTSPIRRYADLTVHRALAEYLRLTDNARHRPRSDSERRELSEALRRAPDCLSEEELAEIGRHATHTEVNAEMAERELRSFLVLQLLEGKVGETYAGVVTNVNPRGIFVQIDKYLVDGFIKSEDLPGDVTRDNLAPSWRLDQRTGALVDQRSGRSFKFGDLVTVRIAGVDLARRQLDLVIDDPARRASGKAKKTSEKPSGGIDHGHGSAKWDSFTTGAQRRSRRSKSRDRAKKHHRRDS
jgi:ribonuclease R